MILFIFIDYFLYIIQYYLLRYGSWIELNLLLKPVEWTSRTKLSQLANLTETSRLYLFPSLSPTKQDRGGFAFHEHHDNEEAKDAVGVKFVCVLSKWAKASWGNSRQWAIQSPKASKYRRPIHGPQRLIYVFFFNTISASAKKSLCNKTNSESILYQR
jgi:hypothetical protein